MIQHVWSVICSNAVIDRETNLVSLFNVIEQFNINDEPDPKDLIGIGFEVVSLWVRSDPDIPCRGRSRITLVKPNGETTIIVDAELNLTEYERLRTRSVVRGAPGTQPGRYVFRIEIQEESQDGKWQEVAALPVKVVVKTRQDLPGENQPD